jgi:hypothetical protein
VDRRNDFAENVGVLVEQPQLPFRILAIGSASHLLVDSRRKHHEFCSSEVGVLAFSDVDGRRQHCAILDISDDALRAFAIPVYQHDFTRTPAHYQG